MTELTMMGLADAVREKEAADLLAKKIRLLSDELQQAVHDYGHWQQTHGNGYAGVRKEVMQEFLNTPRSLTELQAAGNQYAADLKEWAAACRGADSYPERRRSEFSGRVGSILTRGE